MKKLIKYLKPLAVSVVLCMALVFFQVMCDLKLPDYMSDIVNIGVQRYGIDSAVPDAVSEKTMQTLLLLMDEDKQALVMGAYSPSGEAVGMEKTLERYPALKDGGYILTGSKTPELESAMTHALMGVAAFQTPEMSEKLGGMDAADALSMMPPEQLTAIVGELEKKAEALGESTASQAAAMAVKGEYEALGADILTMQRISIFTIGGKMLLVSLLSFTATILSAFLAARIAATAAKNLRADVFKKTVGFSGAEFSSFSTASLITRTTNDIQQLQMLVFMLLRMFIQAPIMGVGGIIYALQKSVSMSWIIALAVVLLLGVMVIIFLLVMPRFKIAQKLIDKLNLVTRENLSGVMVSKAYSMQSFEEKRFDEANRALTNNNLYVNRVSVSMMPLMTIIMNGVSLLIVWVGANQIASSAMQVGDMMAFIQYSMQVVMSFLMVSMMFIFLPRAAVSGDRIWEVLSTRESISDPKSPVSISSNPDKIGEVEFKNVSFRFPGAEEDTIRSISFTAHPGQTTAIIGSTGCGKSTLINLIPRFFDVTEGQVLVNGIDVRDCTQDDLRTAIGYVPQKAVLFTGSISENIKLGDSSLDAQQIETAAQIAQATEFISQKQDGLSEHIAQGGTNVSGGQRQRLSIARAIALNAPIYIFDDSFSALDFKTDSELRRAIHENMQSSTLLIVAQRVGTIKNASQILVLDDGELVGCGTHAELMKSCNVYADIARSQLREEEL